MSEHVFFAFSTGLDRALIVPRGTRVAIADHIASVESTLGLKRDKTSDGEEHWDWWDKEYRAGWPSVPDDVLCDTIGKHNDWVRFIYDAFEEWSKSPVPDGETITPEDARTFWCGLQTLKVRRERWTRAYYTARMEHLYEVMRGRESEGVRFDAKALTPKQAAAVILIFETYLDDHDCALEVPRGRDYLASSYDGGYDWCEKCGAVAPDDSPQCTKRKCPLREHFASPIQNAESRR